MNVTKFIAHARVLVYVYTGCMSVQCMFACIRIYRLYVRTMYVCLNIFVKQITLISQLKRGNYKTYMRAYLQGQQVEGTVRGI